MRLSEEFMILFRAALLGGNPGEEDMKVLSSAGEEDWKKVAAIAREQNVTGLVGDVVQGLPETINIPEDIFLYLLAEREKTALQGRRMAVLAAAIIQNLKDAGLNPILMKGPATAAFYPKPELRSYGDIDLYFTKDEFEKARDIAKSADGFSLSGDGSFHFRKDGVDVDAQLLRFDVSSPEEVILMLSAHAMRHACGTGLGLRQVSDVAMACKSLEGEYYPARLEKALKKAGMIKWQTLLASFINNRLGIQIPYPGKEKIPDTPLLKIVEDGGNFGHHASGRGKAMEKSVAGRKLDTVKRLVRKLPFSLRYAPKETLRTIVSLTVGNFKKNA